MQRSPRSMKARVRSSASSSPARSRASAKKEEATALFALLEEHEHEQVSLVYEPSSGYRGIKAFAKTPYGADPLKGKTGAIQSCGDVGYYLADLLYKEGAQLIATDIDAAKLKAVVDDFRATAVGAEEIYSVEANILAPCALGGIINDQTIPQLKVDIVAGGANNQLAEERHGDQLEAKEITYAPDYVINAGGVGDGYRRIEGWKIWRGRRQSE